jgi:SulP family sulfate permease
MGGFQPDSLRGNDFLSQRLPPGLQALRGYEARWLRSDLTAGLVLAAYMLPAGIGDATLAGLPPEAGLYACISGGLLFWLFCSSRHTTVTVTSAISLLVGTSLGTLAGGDPARYAALAAGTALIVGVLGFIAWLMQAGTLVSFISETVMTGFKTGVALHLASTQLPKLFGFHGSHGTFWERTGYFLTHLGETRPASLALGLAALAMLALGKRLLPNRPVALLVVVAGIVAVPAFDLAGRGVALLGEVPQGLPPPGLPALRPSDVNELLPLARACFLLGAVETAAIGRTFARKYRYRLDSNQEFLALSAANLASGLGHGFPVSGGMSQSLVNEGGGARTPVSGLVAAGIMALVTLFLAGLLRDLPQPVLAAIVLMAVTGLFKISELKRLWRFGHGELAVAMAALLGVLGSGLLRGVLIGTVLSVLVLLRRGSRPHTTELGRVPGTDYFGDILRHPENERLPDVFVFRADSGLLYFNVEHVRDRFFELLNQRGSDVRLAVLFLGSSPVLDLAGAELIEELHRALSERGIDFRLAEARGNVRDTLRRAGFEDVGGPLDPHQPVAAVVTGWRAADAAGHAPRPALRGAIAPPGVVG